MLYWFQIIFCSIRVLDFDLSVDLENTSYYLEAVEMTKVCEKRDTTKELRTGLHKR